MKKQLSAISVFPTSKFIAIFYFVFSAIFCIPWGIIALLSEPKTAAGAVIFILPFIYAIMGFICTAIMCWIYNLIAGYFGGIEFTLNDVDR